MKERDVLRAKPILLTVHAIPPSVNHYVKHTRTGRHYQTGAADDFKMLVRIEARDKGQLRAKEYGVAILLFLGAGQKGDVDNFAKVVLDSLVAAQVIDTDAKVTYLRMEKDRDRANPRTEISVWAQ